jgi:hypothetical protein
MSTITVDSSRRSTSGQTGLADRSPGLGVLVVDDDAWLRTRVCHLLETESGFRLAGVAESAEEAMWMAEHDRSTWQSSAIVRGRAVACGCAASSSGALSHPRW